MKRKIAAILAADIAGYSRLVSEDEEETLRRLGAYRSVFDDFIAKYGGRIFNTAGDAVLAEFPSSVDACRCAIDVQESLRTRNMAYPPSRQMNFRIGITVGDVVEREGDLLGDGVNIAARLEGLAPPGGICISRTVREQVTNKLSVPIADIGEQEVKNIPEPVHAYIVGNSAGEIVLPAKVPAKAAVVAPPPAASSGTGVMLAGAGAVVAVAAGLWLWNQRAAPASPPPVVAAAPAPAAQAPPPPAKRTPVALVADQVPLVSSRAHLIIRDEYMTAKDKKALAISPIRIGMATGHDSEDTAKAAALETCNDLTKRARPDFKCDLYAVGLEVVDPKGPPPMPPEPWLVRESAVETPFAVDRVPITDQRLAAAGLARYAAAKKVRAMAISNAGHLGFYIEQDTIDDAVRRALQSCGYRAGTPCRIIAVDDVFTVPIPVTMKAVGFFAARTSQQVAADSRDALHRQLANNPGGWSAVAVGAGGLPGAAVKAAGEQAAVDAAMAACARKDSSCRIVAIGPFTVQPR